MKLKERGENMVKYFLFVILTIMIFFTNSAHANNNNVIILCYHQLVTREATVNSEINIEDFKQQMEYLYQNEYRILSLTEMINYYRQGSFPAKSVLITFDDGYRTFYTKAFPILKKYNFNAVIFPIVSHLSGITDRKLWSEPLSFWDLRYMVKNSEIIEVGSHTYNLHHYCENGCPVIYQCSTEDENEYRDRVIKDLRVSKELLELQLEKEIFALAWPYGKTTEVAQEKAKNINFKLFFNIMPEPFTPEISLYEIPRFLINEGCLDYFKNIVKGKK